MFGLRVMSGALIAGLGGKWVSDGLLATGALRGYAISLEKRNERRMVNMVDKSQAKVSIDRISSYHGIQQRHISLS